MRLYAILVVMLTMSTVPATAAPDDKEMEQQRCVWGCLAKSKGNTDPAYTRCVQKYCDVKPTPSKR